MRSVLPRIETVIFDVGGPLVDYDDAAAKADLRERIELSEEQFDEAWSIHIPFLSKGSISQAEFWHRVARYYVIRPALPNEDLFGTTFREHASVNRDMLDYAEELKGRGVGVAVLSNTIEPHANIIREWGVYDPFPHVFLSHETGKLKPSLASFGHALEVLGTDPEHVAFVDDELSYLREPRAMGITAVPFFDTSQAQTELEKLLALSGL